MLKNRSSKNPFLPPSADFGRPGSGFEPPYFTKDAVTFKNESRYQSEPNSSTASDEVGAHHGYENDTETDQVITEQGLPRRSINFITKDRIMQQTNASLGPDYSKFYEAFGFVTKQDDQDESEPAATVSPAKRRASTTKKPSKRTKPNRRNSSVQTVESRSVTPVKKSSSEDKVQATKPRGSGIYKTGTWAYASDDDQEDEKIKNVVKEITAITEASAQRPAKITRGSYREMKSKLGGESPAPTISASTNPTTSSVRAGVGRSPRPSRIVSLKSSYFPKENDDVLPNPTASASPSTSRKQDTPSTRDSPASEDSTPEPDQITRSTSASAGPQMALTTEQLTRPKMSWNAIVYGVIANSEKPTMTLSEIMEGVKARHPFFRSVSQAETVKSSPRNPLYNHEAFYKEARPDGSIAWGIKPGEWYDKKTKKQLTPGPPNPDTATPIKATKQPSNVDTTTPKSTNRSPNVDITNPPNATKRPPYVDTSTPKATKRPLNVDTTVDTTSPTKAIKRPRRSGKEEGTGKSPDSTSHTMEAHEAPTDRQERPEIPQSPEETSFEFVPEPVTVERPSSSPLDNGKQRERSWDIIQVDAAHQDTDITRAPRSQSLDFSLPQSKDHRRLEGLVHKDLVEKFTDNQMVHFIQETKMTYFKNLELQAADIDRILADIFPDGCESTGNDMEACARDLGKDYLQRTWESDKFLNFVKREVTKFDDNMVGFCTYMDRRERIRLDFWLVMSKWNRENFNWLFKPLGDTVDLDRVYDTKHWFEFVRKMFCIVCDATWEYHLQPKITINKDKIIEAVRSQIADRYPDRSSSIWEVPKVRLPQNCDPKTSAAGTDYSSRPGSATQDPIRHPCGTDPLKHHSEART